MNKLMIAAAVAAISAGAFAEADPQVYEMNLTVKTTQCDTLKKVAKTECGEFTLYRKQITRKYQGLFWGCGCETIACPDGYFAGLDNDEYRYLFWSATKGFQFRLEGEDDAFAWNLLQVVGPKAQNVEGSWTLQLKNVDDEIVLDVAGAGYGTATQVCTENAKIKSMSGYVIGVNDIKAEVSISGCYYCGEEADCTPFAFCDCIDADEEKTAVFGSWTLKFNASAAKKLTKGGDISTAYKFPKYVSLDYSEDSGDDTPSQSAAEKAEAAYKAAKEVYDAAVAATKAAKEALDDLDEGAEKSEQGKALTKAADEAATAAAAAATATTTADTALKAGKLSDRATAGADVADAKAQIVKRQGELDTAKADLENAKTEAEVTKAKTDIEAAEKALADAEKALSNTLDDIAKSTDTAEKKAAFDKLVSDYDAAVAAKEEADAAKKEADDALNTWKTGDAKTEGSWAKAQKDALDAFIAAEEAESDAKTEVLVTKAACNAVGGDCK